MIGSPDYLLFLLGLACLMLGVRLLAGCRWPLYPHFRFWAGLALMPAWGAAWLEVLERCQLFPPGGDWIWHGSALGAAVALVLSAWTWKREPAGLRGERRRLLASAAVALGAMLRRLLAPGSVPVVVLLAALAFAVLAAFWLDRTRSLAAGRRERMRRWLYPLVVVLLLAAGGWISGARSRAVAADLRQEAIAQAATISQTIYRDRITTLAFAPKDVAAAHSRRLQSQLDFFARALGLRGIVSYARDGETISVGASSTRGRFEAVRKPIPEATKQLVAGVFDSGQAVALTTGTGGGGRLLRSFTPMVDPIGGTVQLVIQADVDAVPHDRLAARSRLLPMLFTATLLMLLLAGSNAMRLRAQAAVTGAIGRFRYAESLLVGSIAFILTIGVALTAHSNAGRARRHIFNQLADTQAARVSESIRDIREYQVIGIIRFFDGSDNVTRTDFRVYTLPMTSTTIVHGVGWAPWLDLGDRPRSEWFLGSQDSPGFAIRERLADGRLVPVEAPRVCFPLQYVEPSGSPFLPLGYDLGADPRIRPAIDEAVRSGLVTATDPMLMPGDTEPVILLVAPIFATVTEPERPNLPRADGHPLRGVLQVAIHLDFLLRETISDSLSGQPHLGLHLFRLHEAGRSPELSASWPAPQAPTFRNLDPLAGGDRSALISTYPLNIAGKPYLLVIRPGPGFRANDPRHAFWQTLLIGMLLALLLAYFVAGLTNRRLVLERAVRERAGELQASEARFRGLFENTLTGIALHRIVRDGSRQAVDYIILSANPAFERSLGMAAGDFSNRRFGELLSDGAEPPFLSVFDQVVRTRQPETFEGHIGSPGRHFLIHAYWMGEDQFATVLLDITERRRAEQARLQLEEQLEQARRFEAIGHLAGGMAHDLNNLLTPIQGYAEMLESGLPLGHGQRKYPAQIIRAATRARDLVRQLLAAARKQTLEMKPLDLNAVVSEYASTLTRVLGENVDLQLRLLAGPAVVEGDRSQIEQILLQLAIHAQDGMPAGGALVIETGNAAPEPGVPGALVALQVSDDGAGLDEETLAHLFDPFFSPRGRVRRGGLGLAAVYGIVTQHNGRIAVHSEPGRGTTFRMTLPAASRPAEVSAGVAGMPRGRETLLVAEDQDQVREMVCSILQQQGYTVLGAASGEEALQLAAQTDAPIHLLVSDVIMTGIDGNTLLRRLAATRPGMRVLFMSGYTENVIEHHGVLDAGVEFIRKPFAISEFCRKVREVLDRAPAP